MNILKPPAPKIPHVSTLEAKANAAYKRTLGSADKTDKEKAAKELATIKTQATEKLAWYEGGGGRADTVTKNKKRLEALLEDLSQVVK